MRTLTNHSAHAALPLVLGALMLACGPEPYGDWMLGAYSGGDDVGRTPYAAVGRYYIRAAGEFEFQSADYTKVLRYRRTWEHIDADSIRIYPGPDDLEYTQVHESWVISRGEGCGPHELAMYRDGRLIAGPTEIYRGEMCVRTLDAPCNGECDCCETYWCSPPPPCDEDGP